MTDTDFCTGEAREEGFHDGVISVLRCVARRLDSVLLETESDYLRATTTETYAAITSVLRCVATRMDAAFDEIARDYLDDDGDEEHLDEEHLDDAGAEHLADDADEHPADDDLDEVAP